MSSYDEFQERKADIQRAMLEDIEADLNHLRKTRDDLYEIEEKVITRMKDALEDNSLSPYKGAVAFKALIDGRSKMSRTIMDEYDRVSGVTIGVSGTVEESEADENEVNLRNPQVQREAEKMVLEFLRVQDTLNSPEDEEVA